MIEEKEQLTIGKGRGAVITMAKGEGDVGDRRGGRKAKAVELMSRR